MESKKVFTKEEAMKALDEAMEMCKKPLLKKDGTPKRVSRQTTAEQVGGMLAAAWAMYLMGALEENEMEYYTHNALYYVDYWDDLYKMKEKNANWKKQKSK